MMQRILQAPQFTVHKNFLVRIAPAPRRFFAPKEANIEVGIPPTAPPPTLQIMHQSRNRIAGELSLVACQGVQNFIAKPRRNAFVRIDQQNPILRGLGMSVSLLIPIAGPAPLNDVLRVAPANFRRSVRAKRIYYDDFVAPSQALQTVFDAVLFVIANDDSGHRRTDFHW